VCPFISVSMDPTKEGNNTKISSTIVLCQPSPNYISLAFLYQYKWFHLLGGWK
jgi:hypothetical protein